MLDRTGLALQQADVRDRDGYQRDSPLQGYMAFLDALHVEAHGRDGAMTKYQRRDQRRGSSRLREAAKVDIVETVSAARATRADVDALDSELAALDGSQSFRPRSSTVLVLVARAFPKREDTHRQNAQQRRLACVLQSDHGNVHLGRPAQ